MGSPNFWQGGLHDVLGICLHTMVGTLAGTDAEFGRPASQVSAHFGVGLDGTVHQYVSLTDAAWANGGPNPGWRWPYGPENPNLRLVSIETEDLGQPDTQPVTEEQYAAVAAVCRQALTAYPASTVLVAHNVINPQHSCPAARWLSSGRFDQLATDLGLQALR